jgi:N,N-dimethylformamidase
MTLLGYVDRVSARPGEALRFMVSADRAATADVRMVRLRCGLDEPFGPGRKILPLDEPSWTCRVDRQPVAIGSYGFVQIDDAGDAATELTVAAWVQPTLVAGEMRDTLNTHAKAGSDMDPVVTVGVRDEQGLVVRTSADGSAGYALFIDADGAAGFRVTTSDGLQHEATTGVRLPLKAWTLVVGRRARDGELTVTQHSVGPWTTRSEQTSSAAVAAPLGRGADLVLLGAMRHRPVDGAGCLSGKLDSPTVWHRRLTDHEVEALRHAASPRDVAPADIWSAWDLGGSVDSDAFPDAGGAGRHGRLVNRPMRAATGFNWKPGTEDFRQSRETYGAIHFHPDDVDDVGWAPTFEWRVPRETPSGIYAAEVTLDQERELLWFVVTPQRGGPRAPAVVLLPTLTYLAYANNRLPYPDVDVRPPGFERVIDPRRRLVHRTPALGQSLYDEHSDGSGVCYASLLRPMPDNRPDFLDDFVGGGRHLAGDLYLIDWMMEQGLEFDVVTDHDLDAEGLSLIEPYRVLITGSHPEYVTANEFDALFAYGEQGGNLMYLGGNGFFWVSSLSGENRAVMECRRGAEVSVMWRSEPGESHHGTTGEMGGLWARHGRSAHALTGVGFTSMGTGSTARPFERQPDSFRPEAAFVFEGVGADEPIGDFGYACGGAGGDEIDRADVQSGTPEGTLVLATASGFSHDYWVPLEDVISQVMPPLGDEAHPLARSDMVLIPRDDRGSVFSVGSISWTASLGWNGYDNNVSRITRNVLDRFLGAI